MSNSMLKVEGLKIAYGPVAAVHGISFNVDEGELVTIIGANGAGKTSTLNAIMGLVQPTEGDIHFEGTDLRALSVERRARSRIAIAPEGRRVFGALTVRENLMAGGTTLPSDRCEARIGEMADRFPVLRERFQQPAGTLSGGEQQMLAIARALMVEPKFLILDEPSLGLAPKIVSLVFELISELNVEGVSILLVEQNVRKSLAIADRAYVMELGRIVREGRAAELAADPKIHESYLGAA